MQTLSDHARAILDRMEPGRAYEPADLRPFVPDASLETLRTVMHELWVHRQVERFGYAGWRRQPSVSGVQGSDIGDEPAIVGRPLAPTKVVKPEDLFDHDTFSGFFK